MAMLAVLIALLIVSCDYQPDRFLPTRPFVSPTPITTVGAWGEPLLGGDLEVTVYDERGALVAGATVFLGTDANVGAAQLQVTGADGRVVFGALTGAQTVTAALDAADGLRAQTWVGVDASHVALTLERPPGELPDGATATVTGTVAGFTAPDRVVITVFRSGYDFWSSYRDAATVTTPGGAYALTVPANEPFHVLVSHENSGATTLAESLLLERPPVAGGSTVSLDLDLASLALEPALTLTIPSPTPPSMLTGPTTSSRLAGVYNASESSSLALGYVGFTPMALTVELHQSGASGTIRASFGRLIGIGATRIRPFVLNNPPTILSPTSGSPLGTGPVLWANSPDVGVGVTRLSLSQDLTTPGPRHNRWSLICDRDRLDLTIPTLPSSFTGWGSSALTLSVRNEFGEVPDFDHFDYSNWSRSNHSDHEIALTP